MLLFDPEYTLRDTKAVFVFDRENDHVIMAYKIL